MTDDESQSGEERRANYLFLCLDQCDDPREALALAREMEAFVVGEGAAAPVPVRKTVQRRARKTDKAVAGNASNGQGKKAPAADRTLAAVRALGAEASNVEIAAAVGVGPTAVSGLLRGLEAAGKIRREGGRKARRIIVTQAAVNQAAANHPRTDARGAAVKGISE